MEQSKDINVFEIKYIISKCWNKTEKKWNVGWNMVNTQIVMWKMRWTKCIPRQKEHTWQNEKKKKEGESVMKDKSRKPCRETVAGKTEVQSERTNTGRNPLTLKLVCTWRLKGLSAYQVIKWFFSLAKSRHMAKHTWLMFLKLSSL